MAATGAYDVAVAKFDSAGVHLWSALYGSHNDQHPLALAVDPSGNILVTGYFVGRLDFGGGPLFNNLTSIFLAQLDPGGNHLYSDQFGAYAWGRGLAAGPGGSVFLTGSFQGSVDFGGGPLSAASSGYEDLYLVRFGPQTTGTPGEPDPTPVLMVASNPVRVSATVRFHLAEPGPVDLAVFDVRGRRVATLASGMYPAGTHPAVWDHRDGRGRSRAGGVYYLRLETGGTVVTKKVVVLGS